MVPFVVQERSMSKSLMLAVFLAGAPAAAHAQDANGSSAGAGAGGGTDQTEAPLGTTAGSDRGVTTTNQSTFRHYVLVDQRTPSYEWLEHPNVAVGDVLPYSGVRYYSVPPEYGKTQYRYTVINREPVLVDPYTRRIVQVVR
jgi:hypothetical protein